MILPDAVLPDYIANCANQALDNLRQQCGKNIYPDMDGSQLLTLRSKWMQFKPATQISANQSCHLLTTQNQQWIALNLSRASDWELLPALFKQSNSIDTWEQVTEQVKNSLAIELVEQGRTLGLAIALAQKNHLTETKNWFDIVCSGRNRIRNKQAQILDLSSLWAGPLCSHLLQQCGAQVTKVESKQRPDGARLNTLTGAKDFHDWLNRDKEQVTLDFANQQDIEQLKNMIAKSDIVIEGSRPRALRQLGIDAETIIKQQAGLIWISITGYGRHEPNANWVAYGDDAAVSAGLFDIVKNKPVFIGDAIADPLTGLHAALVAQQYYQRGQSVLIDINLHNVAKYCAGITTV